MELTESSLILRTGKFRENDLWVKMLTPNHGILTAFAFGASRSRRRFTGCLDSYNYVISRISSSKNGQFLNLQETSLLESYSTIRKSWQKQGLLANCINFLEALGVNSTESTKIFAITKSFIFFVNSLDEMGLASKSGHIYPQLFRYRMATESGYALDLNSCRLCGQGLQSGSYFLISEGYFVCKHCKPLGITSHYADKTSLDILFAVQGQCPTLWGNLENSADGWRAVTKIIDALVQYHLGVEWVDGRFRRS